jgi:hypothetical protein
MRFLWALSAAVLLCSCAANRFYERVDGKGVINGRPAVVWTQPDKFVYVHQLNTLFSFERSNGEVVRPGSIETDGGSIPRFLWSQKGYSPWSYAPAYLIHDWLYEAHRRKEPAGVDAEGNPIYYTKEQADWIMAEVIKAQMENPEQFNTPKSPGHLSKIYWAVNHFGSTAWESAPRPIEERNVVECLIGGALENLPLLPVLGGLKHELLNPMPTRPSMQGSKSHVE